MTTEHINKERPSVTLLRRMFKKYSSNDLEIKALESDLQEELLKGYNKGLISKKNKSYHSKMFLKNLILTLTEEEFVDHGLDPIRVKVKRVGYKMALRGMEEPVIKICYDSACILRDAICFQVKSRFNGGEYER